MTPTRAPSPPGARVPMNPRIRERRLAVRRDEGRRRLRLVGAVAGLAAAGAAAWGVTRSPLLDVDTVVVHGASHTTAVEVLRAAGLEGHPPMTTVDARRAARAVEQLPWVDSARVARRWPGTVEVTLLERAPLAVAPAPESRWAILDPTGRVLAHADALPPGFTQIETPQPVGAPATVVPPAVRRALTVVESLPEPLSGRVPRLRVGEDGSLELALDGKVPVAFGGPEDLRAKLVALTTLVQKADLARVRSIDVRAPTAPVLTRR